MLSYSSRNVPLADDGHCSPGAATIGPSDRRIQPDEVEKWRKWSETRFFHFADEMLADSRVRARTHARARA